VQLSNVLYTKTDNSDEFLFRPSISLTVPDIDAPSGIVASPGISGAIVEVRTIGVSPVQIDVIAIGHTAARAITNDPAKLRSAPTGEYEILWKESGTGIKWALVRFPAAGAGSPVKWAAMDGRWWHGTATDYAYAHPVDNPAGANEDVSTDLFIWLPKQGTATYSPPDGLLPNLKAEQVIPYVAASDGTLVIAQSYVDQFKGAVQMQVRDHVPEGWAKMDGSANSTANGGSGLIWTDNRFPRETKVAGEIGSTGETAPALPNHSHGLCATETSELATNPGSGVTAVSFTNFKLCTKGRIDQPSNVAGACNEACVDVELVSALYAEPKWLKTYMLERIDNSGNPSLSAPPHTGHP